MSNLGRVRSNSAPLPGAGSANNLGRAARNNSAPSSTQASHGIPGAPPLSVGVPVQIKHGVVPRLDLLPLDALWAISSMLGGQGTAQLAAAHNGIGKDLKSIENDPKKVKPAVETSVLLRKALDQARDQQKKLQGDYDTTSRLHFQTRAGLRMKLETIGLVVGNSSRDVKMADARGRLPNDVHVEAWVRFHDETLLGLKSPIPRGSNGEIVAWEVAVRVEGLLKAGLTKQALNLAANVVSLNPSHPTAICSLIRVLMHEGKLAEASRVADRLLAHEAVDQFQTASREILAILTIRIPNQEQVAAMRGCDVRPLTAMQADALSSNTTDGVIDILKPLRARILRGDEESAYLAHLELADFASSIYVTPQVRADPKWKEFLFTVGHSADQLGRTMEAYVEPDKAIRAFDADFPFQTLVLPKGGLNEATSEPGQFFHSELDHEEFALESCMLKTLHNGLLSADNPVSQLEAYESLHMELIRIRATVRVKMATAHAANDHRELMRLAEEFGRNGQMDRQLFTWSMERQDLRMPKEWRG